MKRLIHPNAVFKFWMGRASGRKGTFYKPALALDSRSTHNSHTLADGVSGEVLGETGTDAAVVSMEACHFSPDSTNAALMLGVCGRRLL